MARAEAETSKLDEARDRRASLLDSADPLANLDVSTEITSREIKDHHDFENPIELVLRPHFSTAELVLKRFFDRSLPPQIRSVVEQHGERLESEVNELLKAFRIYVATASRESLDKEAGRLERRYFPDGASEEQHNFLVLRRYYEKIRTFNETAKSRWREIMKVVDTFLVIAETRPLAHKLQVEYSRNLALLVRRTDSFLDDLRSYLQVTTENVDKITGSYKVEAAYREGPYYTIRDVLGLEEERAPAEEAEDATSKYSKQIAEDTTLDLDGSVAYSIVLETREHRLNRSSLIAVPLLGSRDWNRTPDYRLEVALPAFEDAVEKFKKAYHVNIDARDIRGPINNQAAQLLEGQGETSFVLYHRLIHSELESYSVAILFEDFPGLARPDVFLYHCGPNVLHRILMRNLRRQGLGDILYLNQQQNTSREFPEALITKLLIDWWNQHFADLSGEDVDSYLTYSRQIEMVRREYRILYEDGVQARKRAAPDSTYLMIESWLHEHRADVFGSRKVEIFRRFIQNELLE